ncbi:MarR family transcriptional regulator [Rhodococcus sp. TAF43]|uniref:MarR family winged helix-turn-helix transcriptional regulator n=1 Tax=unclassified Rhodococcus (in: high G+C Gram-positive bacteria) TaxID=192944 RepID=UPI000E0AB567|nr:MULTISPECIES: MarR family transcriptional regulator [unclassified Rhodococcus (in: high G+C Gram-positive bacteria)]QKT10671.1 MarR family transcriptional regulator [Rhodococcus sp. W8901]RDI35825.1 DNA-binding MarR family transcriptional regulator [Rhodococcus sp. AG1013]
MVATDTADALLDSLRDLVRRGREVSASLARESDGDMLTEPMGAVLSHVATGQGRRCNVLAERMRITPSTLSRHIAHAEDLGYLMRVPDPADRRATLPALTDEGEAVLRRHRERQREWLLASISDWTDGEAQQLVDGLTRLRMSVPDAISTL